MTIKEIAELLGVSEITIRRAIQKQLPTLIKNGVETRLTFEQSKAIIASLRVSASARIAVQGSVEPRQNVEVTKPENMMAMLRAAADTIEAQQMALQIAAPKVETFNAICDSTNLKSVAEVAQIIGTGRNKLFKLMRATGIVNESNRPYQQYIDAGYLQVKDTVKIINGKPQTFPQAFFTGKGELWISRKLSATHQIGAPE